MWKRVSPYSPRLSRIFLWSGLSEDMKKKLSAIPLVSSTVHSPDFQFMGQNASEVAIFIEVVAIFPKMYSNMPPIFVLQQLEITAVLTGCLMRILSAATS